MRKYIPPYCRSDLLAIQISADNVNKTERGEGVKGNAALTRPTPEFDNQQLSIADASSTNRNSNNECCAAEAYR